MDDIVRQDCNDEVWEGFTMPIANFFKMPNSGVDALVQIDNLAELKVVLYVMRHTWGFQEYEEFKKITTDEFMYGRMLRDRTRMDMGTGLSNHGVQAGIAKAIEHGFLECEIDDSDRARIKKSYRLKMKSSANLDTSEDKPRSARDRSTELKTMPYPEYLQTPEWASKRAKALRFAQYRCQLCNTSESLTVHHRTYERRGHELMGDLIVLCKDCHDTFTYNRDLAK